MTLRTGPLTSNLQWYLYFCFLGPSLIGAVILVIKSYSRNCNKETESGTFTIVLYDLGLEAEIVSWDTMDFNFNKGINHLEDNGSCKVRTIRYSKGK